MFDNTGEFPMLLVGLLTVANRLLYFQQVNKECIMHMAKLGIVISTRTILPIEWIPLVILHSYQKRPVRVSFPFTLVISHSYVELPEGNYTSMILNGSVKFSAC